MLYEPPPGFDDCEADADAAPTPASWPYHELEVEGVGTLHARRPLPNAIPNLAGAARAKIKPQARIDHLDLFVQNHLAEGEFETLLARMMTEDDMPPDAMLRVSRAIATAGTARPTRRSST
ncbi:hypothetical protein SEA_VINCENZO_37 [Mycobacterium phage Vincenzo]|uniref:Tail assembly chaperone n=2 Tax=Coopervirus vincenzo TaxID=1983110 RepID=A0A0F6YQZ2_9CAUD|nr:hypothetical protein SEA_VINCENZO_37 [Mycobacterium phage Vincenzo]AKF14299.1 hypothetical protein SEA_VINCENZO_37 [Mycobacterium phage Vincenzo]AKF14702.1 hypothetical protein SEA_ALANGRANT_37 [Mycobacterium phage AlanGrant]